MWQELAEDVQTSDTSNLFRSDAEHAKAAYRAAKAVLHAETGDPIYLSSKPLRVVVRQGEEGREGEREAEAWCAESGFIIRRVGLDSGKTKKIYRGHMGPVTSIDFYTVPSFPPREVLISGSWDKSIRVWDIQTKTSLSTTVAHTDFVKAVLVIPTLSLVVSASTDRDIRLWDLTSLTTRDFTSSLLASRSAAEPLSEQESSPVVLDPLAFNPNVTIPTGAAPKPAKSVEPLPSILALKGHTRPIERLAFYEVQVPSSAGDDDEGKARALTGSVVLISVDSMGAMKTWEVWRDEEGTIKAELRSESRPHEIGIYDLKVGDGELWTASADNSVLLSTYSPTTPYAAPVPTLRLPHPSHIKSLLSLPLSLPTLNSSHLLTGSADELLRIFDLAELDAVETSSSMESWNGLPTALGIELKGLLKEVEGHSHDIIDLAVFTRDVVIGGEKDGKRKKEAWILSASIDGTLRRWKWPDMIKKLESRTVFVPVEEKSLLTEEEERELEELMADDG